LISSVIFALGTSFSKLSNEATGLASPLSNSLESSDTLADIRSFPRKLLTLLVLSDETPDCIAFDDMGYRLKENDEAVIAILHAIIASNPLCLNCIDALFRADF
jgi:hypothetical protein